MLKYILLFVGVLFALPAFATSGACSGHGGVDCSSQSDGYAVCEDGFISSVQYSDMVECQASCYATQSEHDDALAKMNALSAKNYTDAKEHMEAVMNAIQNGNPVPSSIGADIEEQANDTLIKEYEHTVDCEIYDPNPPPIIQAPVIQPVVTPVVIPIVGKPIPPKPAKKVVATTTVATTTPTTTPEIPIVAQPTQVHVPIKRDFWYWVNPLHWF